MGRPAVAGRANLRELSPPQPALATGIAFATGILRDVEKAGRDSAARAAVRSATGLEARRRPSKGR